MCPLCRAFCSRCPCRRTGLASGRTETPQRRSKCERHATGTSRRREPPKKAVSVCESSRFSASCRAEYIERANEMSNSPLHRADLVRIGWALVNDPLRVFGSITALVPMPRKAARSKSQTPARKPQPFEQLPATRTAVSRTGVHGYSCTALLSVALQHWNPIIGSRLGTAVAFQPADARIAPTPTLFDRGLARSKDLLSMRSTTFSHVVGVKRDRQQNYATASAAPPASAREFAASASKLAVFLATVPKASKGVQIWQPLHAAACCCKRSSPVECDRRFSDLEPGSPGLRDCRLSGITAVVRARPNKLQGASGRACTGGTVRRPALDHA